MTLLDLATLLAPVCIGLATGFAIGWGSASDRWRGRMLAQGVPKPVVRAVFGEGRG